MVYLSLILILSVTKSHSHIWYWIVPHTSRSSQDESRGSTVCIMERSRDSSTSSLQRYEERDTHIQYNTTIVSITIDIFQY